MRSLRIPLLALALLVTSVSLACADDDDDQPAARRTQTTQQVYTTQQRQQQQRNYYRQRQEPGFWSSLMDLERRKNRFLLRMIGVGR